MRSAEARSRRPKFKLYKRVKAAQEFAKKLGVRHVDYGNRLDLANVCNHALFAAYERGIPMPESVIVQEEFTEEEYENPAEMAYYISVGGGPGEIHINGGHEGWGNLEEFVLEARADNRIATASPDHILMHELGELAMHQSVGADRYDRDSEGYRQAEAAFRALGEAREAEEHDPPPVLTPLDLIAEQVSDQATEDHSEFVAETFAALMLGRDELRGNEVVMDAFRRFGGDKIVEWTEPRQE
jgi:hypothetical protein